MHAPAEGSSVRSGNFCWRRRPQGHGFGFPTAPKVLVRYLLVEHDETRVLVDYPTGGLRRRKLGGFHSIPVGDTQRLLTVDAATWESGYDFILCRARRHCLALQDLAVADESARFLTVSLLLRHMRAMRRWAPESGRRDKHKRHVDGDGQASTAPPPAESLSFVASQPER